VEPGHIAVRTELVREHLVERLLGCVDERAALDPDVPPALDAVPASPPAIEVARKLARRGYLGRLAETDLFPAARGPTPGLREQLRGSSLETLSAELALAEPAERPDPRAAGWTSWRVPGPGGHVRHFLALEEVRATRPLPSGLDAPKACWFYGFYIRCCEEALESEE
jgi:hypothetical protein